MKLPHSFVLSEHPSFPGLKACTISLYYHCPNLIWRPTRSRAIGAMAITAPVRPRTVRTRLRLSASVYVASARTSAEANGCACPRIDRQHLIVQSIDKYMNSWCVWKSAAIRFISRAARGEKCLPPQATSIQLCQRTNYPAGSQTVLQA